VSPPQRGELTAFGQFLQRIGPRRFEQPVVLARIPDISRDERFCDQVAYAVDDVGWRDLGVRDDRTSGLQAKVACKDRQAAQHHALGF
jgi:hypothetical protein